MKTERTIELIFKLLELEEDEVLHTPVAEHLEKECPEEFKFIEGLPEDQNNKVWSMINSVMSKAFEIGFDKGFDTGYLKAQREDAEYRQQRSASFLEKERFKQHRGGVSGV